MIGKKFKRVLAAIVALAMVLGLVIVSDTTTAEAAGKFTDVPQGQWYYADVYKAVEMGLINGKNETTFAPDANLKYSEAVKLAACMHELYTTGSVTLKNGEPWYQTYVDYCKKNKIISKDYAWDTLATRAGYMEIFANSLPDKALTAINTIPDNSIPDVNMEFGAAKAIYKLYRAGIVNGMDAEHNCKPLTNIRRREVATVLARMMDPTVRKTFSMNDGGSTTPVTPDPGTPGTPLKITKQPQDVTVDASAHTEYFDFTIDGGVEPYKVTVYANGENVGNGPIQKEDTIILNVTSLFDESGKIKFYVVIEDAAGASVTSNTITITRDGTPATQLSATLPSTYSATEGVGIVGVLIPNIKNGSGSYAYEWHYKVNTKDWMISSDKDKDYDLYAHNAGDTWLVYCVVTDTKTNKTATTNTCTITVAAPLQITKQPQDITLKYDETGSVSVGVTGGTAPYTYTWEYDNQGFLWETIENSNDAYTNGSNTIYLTPRKNYGIAGHESMRCVITDAKGQKVISNEFRVNIDETPAAPTPALSATLPSKISATEGEPIVGVIVPTIKNGSGSYTYKWYYRINSGSWNVSGDKDSDYNLGSGALKAGETWEVYCIVTDTKANKNATTNTCTFTVCKPIEIDDSEIKNFELSYGEKKAVVVKVYGGTEQYKCKWQERTSNGWINIEVGDFTKYTTHIFTNNNTLKFKVMTDYRVIVTDDEGRSVTSGSFTVTYRGK